MAALLFPILSVWGQTYNVTDFGAKGDGQTKDTAAIQKAIDECAKSGGGTVLLPAGTYLSGTVYLKSNVEFKVGQGAVLKGSPDKEDYNALDVCPQNEGWAKENSSGAHLILCIEQENVSLVGPGTIDGSSSDFLLDKTGKYYSSRSAIAWRPSQMVFFIECKNVRVSDIELKNSPYWTCFFHGCTHVLVRGAKIETVRSPHTYNGDGIDVDCCRFVTISDCIINTSDDSITLRANARVLKNKQPTEFVTISNCILSTDCNALRIGVGDGQIRRAVISNLVIHDTRTAFNFVSAYSAGSHGCDIQDIRLDNISLDCRNFLFLALNETNQTLVKNLYFTGMNGIVRGNKAQVIGKPDKKLENIQFSNLDLIFTGKTAFMDALNVDGLTFQNCRIEADAPAIRLGAVSGLRVNDCAPNPEVMTEQELDQRNKQGTTRY